MNQVIIPWYWIFYVSVYFVECSSNNALRQASKMNQWESVKHYSVVL